MGGGGTVGHLEMDWCNNQVKSTVTLLKINPNDFRIRYNLRSQSLYRKAWHFTVTIILILAKKPRAPKGGHQLAAPLPLGTTLTDFRKKQWTVGKPVGSGGFGLIYLGKLVVMISTLSVTEKTGGERTVYNFDSFHYMCSIFPMYVIKQYLQSCLTSRVCQLTTFE